MLLSVVACYTQAVTSRLKAERRSEKDTCMGGIIYLYKYFFYLIFQPGNMVLWHTEYTEDAEKHGFFLFISGVG
jgi:hypothetical protein